MKNMNLCIVAGTHGDEYGFGSQVQQLVESRMPGVAMMLTGNPRAAEQNTRYVDYDLNRSFSNDAVGYEAERAEELRSIFQQEGFTHVVDIHTSPTTHGIVPIVPDVCRGDAVDRVVNANPAIASIVRLPADDKPYSLVADFGTGGIALECPRYATNEHAQRVAFGLVQLLAGITMLQLPRDIYQVVGAIPLTASLPKSGQDDFKPLADMDGLSFVAAPEIYKQLGYGHQGMVVQHLRQECI